MNKINSDLPVKIVTHNNRKIAIIDANERIYDTQEVLDLMATAQYYGSDGAMVFYSESMGEDFFKLSTGFAGEILQKFSNYNTQLAIVGDFSIYESKALKDFIYECNKGNHIFWVASLEEALDVLTKKHGGR